MQLTAEELRKLLGRDLTTVRPEILAALTGQQQSGTIPGGGEGSAGGSRDTLAEEKQLLARFMSMFGKTPSAPGGAPGGGGGNAGGPAEPLTPQEIILARSMISGRTMMTSPISPPLPSPAAKVTPREKPSAKPPAGATGEGQDRLAMGVSPADMGTEPAKPTAAAAEEPAAEGFPGWAKAAIAIGGVGLLSAIVANQMKQEKKSGMAPSGTRMIGAGLSALGQFMGQRQRQQVWQAQQEQDRMVRIAIAARKSEDDKYATDARLLIASQPKTKPTPPVGMLTLAVRYGLGEELLESWSKGSIPEELTTAMQKEYETSSKMERYGIAAALMRGLEGLQTAVMYMGEEGTKLKPAVKHYANTITELVGGQAPGAAAMTPTEPEEIYDTSTTGSEEDYEQIAETLKAMDPAERTRRKYQIAAEMIGYGFDPNSPLWQKHIAPLLE